jgi:DNA-binding response OmpR family regulator
MKSLGPQILYTEDDPDTRELVSLVLTLNDCKVTLADRDEAALLLARTNQFDLYLIDNWIPGGSGIDLCKKLREFDSGTPILFYSGAAYESDKQEAFASGAQGYLTKPVDNDELVEEVFRLIAEATNGIPGKKPGVEIDHDSASHAPAEASLRPVKSFRVH